MPRIRASIAAAAIAGIAVGLGSYTFIYARGYSRILAQSIDYLRQGQLAVRDPAWPRGTVAPQAPITAPEQQRKAP
jgi:hypothetical protein